MIATFLLLGLSFFEKVLFRASGFCVACVGSGCLPSVGAFRVGFRRFPACLPCLLAWFSRGRSASVAMVRAVALLYVGRASRCRQSVTASAFFPRVASFFPAVGLLLPSADRAAVAVCGLVVLYLPRIGVLGALWYKCSFVGFSWLYGAICAPDAVGCIPSGFPVGVLLEYMPVWLRILPI